MMPVENTVKFTPPQVDYLAVFNDESKKDFSWIADYIERELISDD